LESSKKDQGIYPGDNLYDTEDEAKKGAENSNGMKSLWILGTYPIEIELPL
jgi:hypothetical protein